MNRPQNTVLTGQDPAERGDYLSEAGRVGASMVLARRNMSKNPEIKALGRTEAQARMALAAAIIAWDRAEEQAAEENRHTMHEQMAVEQASHAYAQALADLIRGHSSNDEDDE